MPSPTDFIALVNRNFPEAWAYADQLRSLRGTELPEWPEYVFLPLAGWYETTCALLKKEELDLQELRILQALSVAGAWRVTQDIVRFDHDVYESLVSSGMDWTIPGDVFFRLPAWCIYVETPGLAVLGSPQAGFFALFEHDVAQQSDELRLYFLSEEGGGSLLPVILHLKPEGDLASAVAGSIKAAEERKAEYGIDADFGGMESKIQADSGIQSAISLLLYICVYGLREDGRPRTAGSIQRPQPKKTKRGWRLFPAPKPTVWHLGEKTGQAIRVARETSAAAHDGERKGPRPHIRRAHWHSYWTGKKTGPAPQKLIARWLPPVPVALEEDDDKGR